MWDTDKEKRSWQGKRAMKLKNWQSKKQTTGFVTTVHFNIYFFILFSKTGRDWREERAMEKHLQSELELRSIKALLHDMSGTVYKAMAPYRENSTEKRFLYYRNK